MSRMTKVLLFTLEKPFTVRRKPAIDRTNNPGTHSFEMIKTGQLVEDELFPSDILYELRSQLKQDSELLEVKAPNFSPNA